MVKEILHRLFKTTAKPVLVPGSRVNLCSPFEVQRADGVVEAIDKGQAWVSWPNGASEWIVVDKLDAVCA